MKFFTRQLYDAQQGDPDLPEVIQAETQWDTVSAAYEKHLQSVRPHLPDSMRQFSKISLHDGLIRSTSIEGDEIRFQIDGCGCWGPGGSLELVFRDVKSVIGLEDCINDTWLYEEVHLSDDAGFEYHVLLQHSELVVAAGNVELIEKNE